MVPAKHGYRLMTVNVTRINSPERATCGGGAGECILVWRWVAASRFEW